MAKTQFKNRKGAVEVVSAKGVRIPIYESPVRGMPSYQLAFYKNGVRTRERTATLETARKRAKELIEELATGRAHEGVTFTLSQAAVINDAVETLKPLNVPLSKAVREYADAVQILNGHGSLVEAAQLLIQTRRRQAITPIRFPDLAEKFLTTLADHSYRYRQDTQARLRLAAKAFAMDIQDITTQQIDAWLDSIGAKARTRNNYRTSLTTLFSYARNQGYLPDNETTAAEKVKKVKPGGADAPAIYTPEQLTDLLSNIDRKWIPFVAIAAFTGIRSAELHRLEWKDIWLKKGYIEVAASKAKTASRRLVPILPNLRKWLEIHAKNDGTPSPRFSHDSTLMVEFGKATDAIDFKRVHNGFRHSFASYRLAQTQNAAQVALEMGNSPRKLFENYRELVTPEEAKEWFSIEPQLERQEEHATLSR